MPTSSRHKYANIGAVILLIAGIFFLARLDSVKVAEPVQSPAQTAGAASPDVSTSTANTTKATTSVAADVKPQTPKRPSVQAIKEVAGPVSAPQSEGEVRRTENPYPTSPIPFPAVNVSTRAALVNILCSPQGGALRPISGSGVIIDPRGVILTNAHVAQYVLLSQSPDIDLTCTIRMGAPAMPRFRAHVLSIPAVWVNAHAHEINSQHVLGTGEHDYALLLITNSTDGNPRPASFPYLEIDTRQAIAFQDDEVLAASYPVEFIGGLAAQSNLYPVSSVTSIKKLITFTQTNVDLISLGGIIGAQSGSSGGAVVNSWKRLVGLIVTTSEGITTGERDLRALTLSYINRDFQMQTGQDLATTLQGDVVSQAIAFDAQAERLLAPYVEILFK